MIQSAPMRIGMLLCCLLAGLALSSAAEASDQFPVYDNITANVNFWTKVYTEYSTTQAIVHDSKHLDIIYAVIDLRPFEEIAARKINRRRMKVISKKYENILQHLAADPDTKDVKYRRVADLFGPQGNAETFRAASTRVRCQIGQSDRFRLGLIRSGAYIDRIKDIFRSYDLPEELAYLPHVESSFNIKAYSKFGAAGIWQFTRSTGKRFMKVGYVLDERRDPILATHAAASLLKDNFQKLGSWPLAITAYNHGATGMERAKASFGDYPAVFESYSSRTFKFASRNFYSEFLAAFNIASNYQSYFGDIELERPARFQTVSLDGYAEFKQLCSHFGVSPETARSLNPALRSPVFDGQKLVPKGYPFRLPANQELAAIPPNLFEHSQRPSHFYTVQKGDTAGKIARLNGVKLTDLIMANNLDRRAAIYPKQTLRIPLPGQTVAKADTKPGHGLSVAAVLASNEVESTAVEPAGANEIEPPATDASEPGDAPPVLPEAANNDNDAMAAVAPEVGDDEPPTMAATEPGSNPPVLPDAANNGDGAMAAAAPDGSGNEPLTIAAKQSPDEQFVSKAVSADDNDEAIEPGATAEEEPIEPAAGSDDTIIAVESAVPDGKTAEELGPVTAAENEGAIPLAEEVEDAGETYPQAVLASIIPTAPPEIFTSAIEASDGKSDLPPSIEIVAADVGFEAVAEHGNRTVGVLQVEIEETLGHYADWADVRTQQIRRLNGLPFGQTLHLHQKIKIPLTRKTARAFEESRYEYHKRLQEDFFAVYRVTELQPYRVRSGDNLWTLCLEKFDIPMWLLKNCNPEIDLAALRLHQKIMVPVIEKYTSDDPGLTTEPEHDETKATTGLQKVAPS